MATTFEHILTTEEMEDKVLLQLGMALFNIDPARKVLQSFKDLPAVGVKFVLIEPATDTTNGIEEYGREVYYNAIDDVYIEDTVMSNQQTYNITASLDKPKVFLKKLRTKRNSQDWWYEFFNKENIGITTIGDIRDASIPTENGDWEVRSICTIELNYLSKESVEIVNLGSVELQSVKVDGIEFV